MEDTIDHPLDALIRTKIRSPERNLFDTILNEIRIDHYNDEYNAHVAIERESTGHYQNRQWFRFDAVTVKKKTKSILSRLRKLIE